MVVGLGENRMNGRRCVLITLEEADILKMLQKGIELNAEAHPGFPADLEICLVMAADDVTIELAQAAYPNAVMIPLPDPPTKTRES